MPLDPDHSPSPPPPPHRDWFFPPAPPFLPSSRSFAPRAPFPSTSRSYKPYSPADRRPLPAPRSRSRSPHPSPDQQSPQPPSAPRLRGWDPRYAGVRRGDARAPAAAAPPAAPRPAAPDRKSPPAPALTLRWSGMLSAAAILLCFASLLHRNFSLHDQVHHLRGQLGAATAKLQSCIVVMDSSLDMSSVFSYQSDDEFAPSRSLKNFSLLLSLAALYAPIVILKYIDLLSKLRRSRHSEDVAFNKRLAYRVDIFLSLHPYAKPLVLLVGTMLLIGLGGLALYGVTDDSLSDCLWLSWTFVADAGNHANAVGFGPKLVSVSISIGGMLVFAMMLGLVTDSISEKFDSLRKGRSEVIEQSHTLILGWSDKLGSLLNQICIANESLGGGTIVVMAEKDKEEMEADIAKMEFDLKGTAVICRSGSPLILADLKKVSVSKARAIVVLAEEGNADQSDARALRIVLSLTGVKEGLRGHIVVELSDLDNEVLVKLVGGDLVETVVAHDVIGRLMIQCARQPGLAQIWEDILGFENCEFYIKRWPQLVGMQFEDVLISFPDAVPCGIKMASYGGKIILNPDDCYVLQEGDEVIVIAEDDDTYTPAPLPKVRRGYPPKDFVGPKSPERILFCGWRRDMEDMIMVLDAFLAPGSELWMFNDVPEIDRERKLIDGGLDFSRLENITLVHREGNAVIRRHLESLPLESFDSILILADESVEDSAIQADSRSLATLLLIRDIQAKRLPYKEAIGSDGFRRSLSEGSWMGEMQQASDKSVIISEILDPRTKNLLYMSKISDYVLSNELVSMALAMVAEDRQINYVLEELFAEQGNELQIRQSDLYLREDEELNFFEVMLRARQRKEVVIGYRLEDAERAIINPPDKVSRRRWSPKDVFVAIAEKE
ncbi:putative ion channel CASTOR [Hordeum vulgare]|uniref:probable ion channel CASTOR isoform X1 n=1 Tax=Hordeum vulgare subsp. vulgare TaxID=112509 RepID=UPI001D1A4E19|nr:probable ion channel CASTOR isoform X1 [Hordeum vulgare subsp. vulgare]KAE8800612.1 putative ion channel CASTOR [Hordeum vulgare]